MSFELNKNPLDKIVSLSLQNNMFLKVLKASILIGMYCGTLKK